MLPSGIPLSYQADRWHVKTFKRFTDAVEGLEQMTESPRLECSIHFWAQSGKAYVAIAFNSFFQTTQEEMSYTIVQLTNRGAIEHHGRSIDIDAALELKIESPLMTYVELLWQRSYRNGLSVILHRL